MQLIRPLRGMPQWPSDERALEWHERRRAYPSTGHVLDRRQLLRTCCSCKRHRDGSAIAMAAAPRRGESDVNSYSEGRLCQSGDCGLHLVLRSDHRLADGVIVGLAAAAGRRFECIEYSS